MRFLSSLVEKRWALTVLVFVAYLALALIMMWPLPLRMGEHVIAAKYHWDAYTNTMLLGARVDNFLGTGPGGHYDNYFFAPIPNSLAFNENLFGLALLYAPFHLASGNPLFAYNATLFLSLALSSHFTYMFLTRLTGSRLAAFVLGAAFPYCPYAFFEMGRIQLVATQWIPLTFYFMHRAFEEQRLRDVIGFGLSYVLQIGTCLYYAMFLLPLLAVLGIWLYLKHPPRSYKLLVHFGVVGVCAAAITFAMISPYFASRKNFSLTRSEDFAENFDGSLSFFANVNPSNRTLTFLHHEPATVVGALEEIAFPGFLVAALAITAILVTIVRSLRKLEPEKRVRIALGASAWLGLTSIIALLATLATHSMLIGTVLLAVSTLVWLRRVPHARLLPAPLGVYTWLLLLAVLLFLGLSPFEYGGKSVHGLYYYLHTYVPGWNGVRKVSRQAILTSFIFIVLASFGAEIVLSAIKKKSAQLLTAFAMLAIISFEFREAPVPLKLVPAGDHVPPVYGFIAKQPGKAPIAVLPTQDGRVFRGHPGLALNNYLALYHHRRTLNGKSSFIPPVTRMFNHAMGMMPNSIGVRVLRQLGAQFVLVHAWDMPRERSARILRGMDAATKDYKLVFRDRDDYVYEVLPRNTSADMLADLPPMPKGNLSLVPGKELTAKASFGTDVAKKAFDGNPLTRWTQHHNQRSGEWYEVTLATPRDIAAVEMTNFENIEDAPLSYKIEVAEDEVAPLRTIIVRPRIRIFRDQVFHPNRFVWRVVLPEKTLAKRLRITLVEATPNRWWSIHELKLYAR